jgi:hypothetical protein
MVEYENGETPISIIKCDVGSLVGHHITPKPFFDVQERQLTVHEKGEPSPNTSELAWDIFQETAKEALELKLDAKQDLLKTNPEGSISGMGPSVLEIEIDGRRADPMVVFAGDKTHATGHPELLLKIASAIVEAIRFISIILGFIIIQQFLAEKYGSYVAGICSGAILTLLVVAFILCLFSLSLRQNAKTNKPSSAKAR